MKSKEMLCRAIIYSTLTLIAVSCGQRPARDGEYLRKESNILSFLASAGLAHWGISADSLFSCEYIIPEGESANVFVFNGSCSACVSETIDMIQTLISMDYVDSLDIKLFSKTDENDIFYYYLNRDIPQLDSLQWRPICYTMYDREDVPNGLYHVNDGVITNYLPWHY